MGGFLILHSKFEILNSFLPLPPPPAKCSSRQRIGHLFIPQHRHSVDDHIDHALAEVMWILVCCDITNASRIEDHDIRLHAWAQNATVAELRAVGRLRGHLANGLFEREQLFVADVMSQNARESSVRSRMRGGIRRTRL